MFIATWVIAFLVWRLGRIEERWSRHLGERPDLKNRSL
jgi:nickel/cobalt transporter (NiCoT) family protein